MAVFTWGIRFFDQVVEARYRQLCARDAENSKPCDPEPAYLSQSATEGALGLPSGWFNIRRKLGLLVPWPAKEEQTRRYPRRYYDILVVREWFKEHPGAQDMDMKEAIRKAYNQRGAMDGRADV
jgi:hypothetical protein